MRMAVRMRTWRSSSTKLQATNHKQIPFPIGGFVAVKIRMRKLGRAHQPFFRICAIDSRRPRDGKAIEELGHYDPLIKDTHARAVLNAERIAYWLSVGATPSERVRVLVKKYGL